MPRNPNLAAGSQNLATPMIAVGLGSKPDESDEKGKRALAGLDLTRDWATGWDSRLAAAGEFLLSKSIAPIQVQNLLPESPSSLYNRGDSLTGIHKCSAKKVVGFEDCSIRGMVGLGRFDATESRKKSASDLARRGTWRKNKASVCRLRFCFWPALERPFLYL
jgi:hypothetical protein